MSTILVKDIIPTKDGFYSFTAEEIAAIVENGRNFRRYNQANAEQWCDVMTKYGWPDNGSSIVFAAGRLIDGQHRLDGYRMYLERGGEDIIQFRTVVLKDAKSELTIDIGKPRNLGDFLRNQGCKNISIISALVAVDTRRHIGKNKTLEYALRLSTKGGRLKARDGSFVHSFVPLSAMVDRFFRLRKDFESWGNEVMLPLRKTVTQYRAVGVTMFMVGRMVDMDMAKLFVDQLASGASLKGDDPIYELRETLMSKALGSRSKSMHLGSAYVPAVTVKSWNRWIRGEPAHNPLRFTSHGPYAERFPEPIGKD